MRPPPTRRWPLLVSTDLAGTTMHCKIQCVCDSDMFGCAAGEH